jgi:hypothetical protein
MLVDADDCPLKLLLNEHLQAGPPFSELKRVTTG